ncbi:ABC transporter permease [Cohnella sp. GbtcB17]|uniref:ABC transporter permease n=1 Tax=Cohnella sp. GbtcB17 TaxID=2824762 RepID=UPI001C3073F3|nr:ABC transporter permease [Cohnella sp. GbtcB17]
MSIRVLSAELLKIRRKLIWLLVALGPGGVVGLTALNYGLRLDYLTKLHANDLWGGLIGDITALMVPALFMGLAIVSSMAAGIEHQTNAWKMTLALPVTRTQTFLGKFLLTSLLLLLSSTLTGLGTIALGLALGFEASGMSWGYLLEQIYYPYAAIMPFIALQVAMSVMMHNQALPLAVGVAGTVVSVFSGSRFGDWFPWRWPSLQNEANDPRFSAALGLIGGVVILAAGLMTFNKKDVK